MMRIQGLLAYLLISVCDEVERLFLMWRLIKTIIFITKKLFKKHFIFWSRANALHTQQVLYVKLSFWSDANFSCFAFCMLDVWQMSKAILLYFP